MMQFSILTVLWYLLLDLVFFLLHLAGLVAVFRLRFSSSGLHLKWILLPCLGTNLVTCILIKNYFTWFGRKLLLLQSQFQPFDIVARNLVNIWCWSTKSWSNAHLVLYSFIGSLKLFLCASEDEIIWMSLLLVILCWLLNVDVNW